jgi:glc operon protein GlcG
LPMSMSLADAESVIRDAQAHAAKLGIRVSIAVVDVGGNLVAVQRMDGATPMTPAVAEGKALGAAMFQRDGGWLLSVANDRPAFYAAISGMARRQMVPGLGSLPITKGGEILGAVGVSGGKPEQDLECAEAGVSSLK